MDRMGYIRSVRWPDGRQKLQGAGLGHYNLLETSLSNEKRRLELAQSPGERNIRAVLVKQIQREIAGEDLFLGAMAVEAEVDSMSDDQRMEDLLKWFQSPKLTPCQCSMSL